MANIAESEFQDRRDDKLRSLLPLIDDPYDFFGLSEAETGALEEALGDGFGCAVRDSQAVPLAEGIESGLLRHPFFFRGSSEDAERDAEDAFWDEGYDGAPGPSEQFPLNFVMRRLRIYFENQLNRFGHKIKSEEPQLASWDRSQVEDHGLERLYEKAWYEAHAIELLDFIYLLLQRGVREAKGASGFALIVSSMAGELGRLSEQYYWRFRYERAAITGIGARKGASAGGQSKAALYQGQHCAWQTSASEIWKRKPNLSKLAVAEIIRRQSRLTQTAKHIARYISRSQATPRVVKR